MRRKLLLILLISVGLTTQWALAGVPQSTVVLPGIDEATMKVKFAETDMQQMEGIWEYPNEEMKLAIERSIRAKKTLLSASCCSPVPTWS